MKPCGHCRSVDSLTPVRAHPAHIAWTALRSAHNAHKAEDEGFFLLYFKKTTGGLQAYMALS